jgi:N-acetylmuramic acid 6-phosphate etherase
MKSYTHLKSENQNKNTLEIHKHSVVDILNKINDEDQKIANLVKDAIPTIRNTIDLTLKSIKSGGRVFYVGAGTSGRLGVLDASEMPPTYSVSKDVFIGVIAGGEKALRNSVEGAEDDFEKAKKDLSKYKINEKDTLIGISCSGAARYIVSALKYAREKSASTVYLITNEKPYLNAKVDVIIKVNTGPEVITGSTRMKAGTATKMVLNMISTTTMIKLGKVYGNLMVDLMAVNNKLVDRGVRIISSIANVRYEIAKQKLFEAEKSVKVAIVMIKKNWLRFRAN